MRTFIQAVVAAALLCGVFTVAAQTGARAAPVSGETSAPLSNKGASPTGHAKVASLNEGFDDIGLLAGAGWVTQNSSTPIGLQPGWFQGLATDATPTPGPFNAHDGANYAYIAANFQNVTGNNTISNWLLTPPLEFGDGGTMTFWTRKPTPNPTDYPDRLEVRISTNGASSNVGSGAAAVGDFTTVALSINPTLVAGGYPLVWTQYTITNTDGLPRNGTGRIAFRYHVTGGGPTGSNSDYIGIDRVIYAGGTPSYQVSGTVSGLVGTGLSLALNGGTPLPINANGAFQFPGWLAVNSSYTVTAVNPANPSQTCTVTNGSGTVSGNVTDVQVACVTDTYTVGGTVSGLLGTGLLLQNNGGDDLSIAADGSFTFATALPDLSGYSVTVFSAPGEPQQNCAITDAAGTLASANVTDVAVVCTTVTYTIGGSVSGLLGGGLVLQNNGGDDLSIAADGSFTFATVIDDGGGYDVTVQADPLLPAQTCSVANGSGTVDVADVENVQVTCVTGDFALTVLSGAVQSADLGEIFADALTVQLTDANGDAVPAAAVTFEAPLTGASADLSDGVQPAAATLSVDTDGNGEALVVATANDSDGCYGVTASASGASASVVFELTNVDPVPPAPEIYEDGFETSPALAKGLVICGP